MAVLMVKMMLRDPSMLVKLRRLGSDEERYIAPPRPYELPEYRKGTKYSTSKEPYVRPTRSVTLVNPWVSRWHTR